MAFPGTITLRQNTLEAICLDYAVSLARHGFTRLCFVPSHGGNFAPLLEMLYRHIGRPEHTYRLRWDAGTLAFWDNRATWHWAVNDYQGQRRLMHRITLDGAPLGAYHA